MKYETHVQNNLLNSLGSGHCGYVYTTYAELVEMFGIPRFVTPSDNKVSCEWIIKWEDGKLTVIYDYKQCKAYLGEDGLDKEDIVDWHLGGDRCSYVEELMYKDKTAEELLIINTTPSWRLADAFRNMQSGRIKS